ncbi:MAG: type II toxin-antitoxin system RelE/ParE family toxin [Deltaproteobacteria bacterium]|nr:type II toxin-antitoxin system RelE/ParE family toxin [Deltaproteobacteria bacterium]
MPAAEADLEEIWGYIADDSPAAADRLVDEILDKSETLVLNPELGRSRDEIRPGLRCLPVGRYLIFYKVAGADIAVVRVLSGYRDVAALL